VKRGYFRTERIRFVGMACNPHPMPSSVRHEPARTIFPSVPLSFQFFFCPCRLHLCFLCHLIYNKFGQCP
jgi:hypothetical protein